jgi:glycosyltransferase involved in cell wall biosynthesis
LPVTTPFTRRSLIVLTRDVALKLSSNTLKVLFLTRYPFEGASSRYRVFQYLPALRKLGVECDVQSFMDQSLYAVSMRPGHNLLKVWLTFIAITRRLRILLCFKRYDVIYLQRELFPFGPPVLERLMKAFGAKLVFDYDDALFIKKASRYNAVASLLRSPMKTRRLFALADCVVAGNEWLRSEAFESGANAVTIEVAEDTQRFSRCVNKAADRVVIGWLGSPSTSKYLQLIAVPLREIAARYPGVEFAAMGAGEFEMQGVPWTTYDWGMEAEIDFLARCNIGLMPLPKEDWSKGKSGGKARTYMASSVVAVVSRIGYNIELISHGTTGMLCTTESDWLKSLSALIEDRALRERIATAARTEVAHRFDVSTQAKKIYDVLLNVAPNRKATQISNPRQPS